MAIVTDYFTSSFSPSKLATVWRQSSNSTFSSLKTGTGTNVDTTFFEPQIAADTTSNRFFVISRAIALFDTTSIPVGATITSATLRFRPTQLGNTLGSPDYHVVSSNPASTSSIAATDYGSVGSTSFGYVAYSSLSLNSQH